jgi:hypothetical protein
VVKYGLNSALLGRNMRGPGYGDTREWLRDEEAVQGTELPGLLGVDVEGAYGGIDEFGQLGNAGLGDLSRTTRTVGGDSAVVAREIGALEVAQTAGTVARTGAANGNKAQTLNGAGDKFAVEAAADEYGDAVVTETPGACKEATMPEGVDSRRRCVVTGTCSGSQTSR